MLKITIIAVGGLKDNYWVQASKEYEKRLSAFCALNIVELPAARLPDDPSDAQIKAALEAESKAISSKLPKRCFSVAMCVEGRETDSVAFSEMIRSAADEFGHIVFIVGGSYGLADEVKNSADARLSMSRMTFPHRLARVMLLEQIYRSFMIQKGMTYHK